MYAENREKIDFENVDMSEEGLSFDAFYKLVSKFKIYGWKVEFQDDRILLVKGVLNER